MAEACAENDGGPDPALRRHLAAQADYRKNAFRLSPQERARVTERWGFAFDAFGYRKDPPHAAEAVPGSPSGGLYRWSIGSEAAKYSSEMPMPEENSIPAQAP